MRGERQLQFRRISNEILLDIHIGTDIQLLAKPVSRLLYASRGDVQGTGNLFRGQVHFHQAGELVIILGQLGILRRELPNEV